MGVFISAAGAVGAYTGRVIGVGLGAAGSAIMKMVGGPVAGVGSVIGAFRGINAYKAQRREDLRSLNSEDRNTYSSLLHINRLVPISNRPMGERFGHRIEDEMERRKGATEVMKERRAFERSHGINPHGASNALWKEFFRGFNPTTWF